MVTLKVVYATNEVLHLLLRLWQKPSNCQLTGQGCARMLYPRQRYRGEPWTPQAAAFHNNLEEFAEQVGIIVGLQSNGKLSQEQAYARIRGLWDKLKVSHEHLLQSPDSPAS